MATRLFFQKWDRTKPGFRGFVGRKTVLVEHCPMFDFDRSNDKHPEVKQLLAEGYEPTGHEDGVKV